MGKPYFLFVLFILACGPVSAQVAVGGTSENFDRVYWLAWDNSVLTEYPLAWRNERLVAGSYVWQYSEDVKIIAKVAPSDRRSRLNVQKYTPGEYHGDGLRHLYQGPPIPGTYKPNGIPYSGLYNSLDGSVTEPFDITIELQFKIRGEWEPILYPGMVIADAEQLDGQSSGSAEYIQATTNATDWQLIDKYEAGTSENYKLEFLGKQITLRATKVGTESQAVLFAKGATTLERVTMKGTGRSALALGFVLPFDVSEAGPYCEAKHYIDDFDFSTDGFGTGTASLNDLTVAPLNAIPTLYIGSSEDPLDHGSLDISELELNFKQDNIQINVPVTNQQEAPATLYWWMDFNNDGVFADDEVKIYPGIAPGKTSMEVSLEFTRADFPEEYQYLGQNLTVGDLHSRLRITTTTLVNDSHTRQDERSCGLATDGEVEDYTFIVKGISISGTVFIDADGMEDGIVDNIFNAGGTESTIAFSEGFREKLYAYLVSSKNDSIVGKASVTENGFYEITNMNHGSYFLSMSILDLSVGTFFSREEDHLPPAWASVGESFGVDNAFVPKEGVVEVLDIRIPIETPNAGMDITGVNFGLDQPPFLQDDAAVTPAYKLIQVAVLDNDSDHQGNETILKSSVLLFPSEGSPAGADELQTEAGSFRVTKEGKIAFKPFNSFHGKTASVAYTVKDAAGLRSETALLEIFVERPRMVTSNPRLPSSSGAAK